MTKSSPFVCQKLIYTILTVVRVIKNRESEQFTSLMKFLLIPLHSAFLFILVREFQSKDLIPQKLFLMVKCATHGV